MFCKSETWNKTLEFDVYLHLCYDLLFSIDFFFFFGAEVVIITGLRADANNELLADTNGLISVVP